MQEPVFQATKNFEYSFLKDFVTGNMTRQHYHDGYEIYLQLSGDRGIFFNNRQYSLKRGSLYIIEPFILHRTTNINDEPCSRNLINFRRPMLEEFLSNKEINDLFSKFKSCIIQLNDEHISQIGVHFEEIHQFWHRKHCGEKRCIKLAYMEVYRLIDKIFLLCKENTDIINLSSLEVVTNPEIYRVLKYVEEHYAEELTADEMIAYSHMSQPTFYRTFKKVTGDTFASYLSRYRLSKAHMLVVGTKLSLNDIARRTGFPSAANMSRVFRQQYDVSPSHFRNLK